MKSSNTSLILITLILSFFLACTPKQPPKSNGLNIFVSIAPQKYFVEKIGKGHVQVSVLVPPGASPHSFEPKPSQMSRISSADIFFSIGIDFEHAWIPRIRDNAKGLRIVQTDSNIDKIKSAECHDHHENETAENGHHDESEGLDPHIWLSPELVKTQANTICNALISADSVNSSEYRQNLAAFLTEIDSIQNQLRSILSACPDNKNFMIFHPAWGYFAKEFNLTEYPIEIEGKEPSPKELAKIIDFAKENKIRTIFVQPQFSAQAAKQIAHEINAAVAEVNDLSENWSENLIKTAKMIGSCDR